MRKNIAKIAAAVLVFSVCFTSVAFAQGWEKQSNGKWYYWQEDGSVAKNQWIYETVETEVPGEQEGETQIVTNTYRYWVKNDGAMAANEWVAEGDQWHYVNAKGLEEKSTLLDLSNASSYYYVDAEGNMLANGWAEVEGEKYYFQNNGLAVRGKWYNIDGDDYYFLKSGKMATNASCPGGGHVGPDGKRTK